MRCGVRRDQWIRPFDPPGPGYTRQTMSRSQQRYDRDTGADMRTGRTVPPSHPRHQSGPDPKWWTLTAVCLGTLMLLLDVTIVNVALPQIQSSLGASFSDVQWVVDAYALTLAALLLTTGSLADQFGRRRLYLIGLVLFTGASVLCGAAQSPLMLELSRGAQGVGGAAMFSVSLALLATAFRGKDRGVAFGVWGALTGIAVAVGPVVGGVLVSGLSWRWIFFVNVPVGSRGAGADRAEGRRVAGRAGPQAGLGRASCTSRRRWPPGLRPHRIRPRRLLRRHGDRLLRRRGRPARRLRGGRTAQPAPDVRPEPVPAADVPRRRHRGVRDVGRDVRDAAVPRAVSAGRPRIQRLADRRAAAGALRRHARAPARCPAGSASRSRSGR